MSAGHWDAVYASKGADEVSWYQSDPEPSLRLLSGLGSVIDIGAGRSCLPRLLLESGTPEVALLDISRQAISQAASDLGHLADRVQFIVADVTDWTPSRTWQAWHDRAVFHFLTEPSAQQAYATTARAALAQGGRLVLGCFASDGPEQCSGLPTARHDIEDLVTIFDDLELVEGFRQVHLTPWGAPQMFTWAVFAG